MGGTPHTRTDSLQTRAGTPEAYQVRAGTRSRSSAECFAPRCSDRQGPESNRARFPRSAQRSQGMARPAGRRQVGQRSGSVFGRVGMIHVLPVTAMPSKRNRWWRS
jgi:hypothetical protein